MASSASCHQSRLVCGPSPGLRQSGVCDNAPAPAPASCWEALQICTTRTCTLPREPRAAAQGRRGPRAHPPEFRCSESQISKCDRVNSTQGVRRRSVGAQEGTGTRAPGFELLISGPLLHARNRKRQVRDSATCGQRRVLQVHWTPAAPQQPQWAFPSPRLTRTGQAGGTEPDSSTGPRQPRQPVRPGHPRHRREATGS